MIPGFDPDVSNTLYRHYGTGVQDMDRRRLRKPGGWNDTVNAYMSKLPGNWPFLSMTTDPRIRTTILEKTGRLLNSKLQGRLVPREGGDVVGAAINNAILDFQWDWATDGGAMQEKIAFSDQVARLFGAAFVWVYWNSEKNCNDIKLIDPRDFFPDPSSSHISNCNWAQIREWTTIEKLKKRGFKGLDELEKEIMYGVGYASDRRTSAYESIVKLNRGLEDRMGEDPANPVIELVTEWTGKDSIPFLPRYNWVLKDKDNRKNPYDHKKIPVSMLRYYPLGDDLYGESEVESVLPLWRAINATLCGFMDQSAIEMRPPVKVVAGQARMETIQYGPNAIWEVNNMQAVEQMTTQNQFIANFNATYPALVAAFNTAMGSESLGISNVRGYQTDKTAREVDGLEKQQNSRDQYNQMYLSQFLTDIMMMWLSNNKQYLFDDPKMSHKIFKILGKDKITQLQNLGMDQTDIPDEAMEQLAATIKDSPELVSNELIQKTMQDMSVPNNPILTNPDEEDPEQYDIKNKLDVKDHGQEADLYVTKEDMDGLYDYVPDVKSMAMGAGEMLQQARKQAMETILNPQVMQLLQMQGENIKMKELLVNVLTDAGYQDADALFQPAQQPQPTGPGGLSPGQPPTGVATGPGIQPGLPPVSQQPSPTGLAGPGQGVQF